MQRTPINPSTWSMNLGFDQAELIAGHQRMLFSSGQDAVDAEGQPQHPGDMAAQLDLALEHLELFKHWSRLQDRFASAAGRFATSVLGVTRLPAPDLLVMLEATALD